VHLYLNLRQGKRPARRSSAKSCCCWRAFSIRMRDFWAFQPYRAVLFGLDRGWGASGEVVALEGCVLGG